jgi:hypothetical protein
MRKNHQNIVDPDIHEYELFLFTYAVALCFNTVVTRLRTGQKTAMNDKTMFLAACGDCFIAIDAYN